MRSAASLICLTWIATPALGQSVSRNFRPDERVVLRDFGQILAVAASSAGFFAATPGGLIVYDGWSGRWLSPVTELDGLRLDGVLTAMGDPADETLWLGTATGLVHYLPVLRQIETIPVSGGVRRLMFDRDDPFRGVFLETATEWLFLPRGGLFPIRSPRMPPANRWLEVLTVPQALRLAPGADATRALVLTDRRLRQFAYSSVARERSGRRLVFGTNGMGVARYDLTTAEFEALRYGLLADGVGAVMSFPGGVWAGTAQRRAAPLRAPATRRSTERVGFTRVTSDGQYFIFEEGAGLGGAGFRFGTVRDLADWDRTVWAATDAGVIGFGNGTAFLVERRLPDLDTHVLAVTPDGLWVGTSRGLALIRSHGAVGTQVSDTWNTGRPVLALAALRDTLFIGTSDGLLVLRQGASELASAPGTVDHPILRDPIVALATTSAPHVIAATRTSFAWRDAGWHAELDLALEVGEITALEPDSLGVWIGGERGIARFEPRGRSWRTVVRSGDLPGPVRDLAVGDGFLWVATDLGLVRFDRHILLP